MSIKRIDSGFIMVRGWQMKYEPTKTRRIFIEGLSQLRRDKPERWQELVEQAEAVALGGVH